VNLHALADYRALVLHRAIASKVARDPSLVARAKTKLDWLVARGIMNDAHESAWRTLLDAGIDDLTRAMVEDSERATELRQVTPFTFVIAPRERWALWARARAEWVSVASSARVE
jgi:hypothetical protein